jgi:hypothetical protein
MVGKSYTSIYVDQETLRKAKDLGLNISKICENALKEAIKRLEGSDPHSNRKADRIADCESPQTGSSECLVDEEGFEPSTSAMPTLRSFQTDLLAPFRFFIELS